MLRRCYALFSGKAIMSRGSPEWQHRIDLKKGKKPTLLHKLGTSRPNNAVQYAQMTIHDLCEWGLAYSPWPLTFGLACCAIEMMHTYCARYDLDHFGIIPRATPRQAEVMIIAGTVTNKMSPIIHHLYDQMPNPKWVISMGGLRERRGVLLLQLRCASRRRAMHSGGYLDPRLPSLGRGPRVRAALPAKEA